LARHSAIGGGGVKLTDSRAQFALFLTTGGFAALVNIFSRYLLSRYFPFEAAVLIAYAIGMVTAYTLFRTFVFGRSGRTIASEGYRFVVVNIVALGLVFTVSVALARVIFPLVHFEWHAQDIAHVIAVCVPAISSYVGHKKYTFGR